jgi:hypothetical protein
MVVSVEFAKSRKLDPTAYKVKVWKRIYAYNFLSWILPFILITVALVLNHYLRSVTNSSFTYILKIKQSLLLSLFIYSPDASKNEAGIFEYAHYRCSSPLWQIGFYAQSLLYLLNILFFICTSLLICKHRQARQIPQSRRAKRILRETYGFEHYIQIKMNG